MPKGIYERTIEHRKNTGKAQKKIWQDSEYRKRMRKIHKGQISPFKGKHHSKETKEKIGQKSKGRIPWCKGKKNCRPNYKHSEDTKRKISKSLIGKKNFLGKKHSEKTKKKMSTKRIGKNNPSWKGGKSRSLHVGRKYKEWRMAVFIRDNFICQFCGVKGGNLEAHHNKSWSKFPKLRYKVDNGITLCKECHKLANKIQRKNEK